jgi:hypothetical protein
MGGISILRWGSCGANKNADPGRVGINCLFGRANTHERVSSSFLSCRSGRALIIYSQVEHYVSARKTTNR